MANQKYSLNINVLIRHKNAEEILDGIQNAIRDILDGVEHEKEERVFGQSFQTNKTKTRFRSSRERHPHLMDRET